MLISKYCLLLVVLGTGTLPFLVQAQQSTKDLTDASLEDLLGRNINKHLDMSASLYNVRTKSIQTARPEEPGNTIPQDGRNFRIKLTGHF